MNRSIILIIGAIIALVVGVGAFFFIRSNQPAPAPAPSPTPLVQAPLRITVVPSSTTFTASQSGSFDVMLSTNEVKIDGFQFIANLEGAGTNVTDSDPVVAGVQIKPAEITGLNPVTNSVVSQGTTQVIRFAMITQNAGQPFSSAAPVKVATVTFVPASTGTIKLDFNPQNTRANKTGTTDDTLITTASVTFTVNPAIAASEATGSANIAKGTTPIACDAACLTDNDCSVGLSCVSNACRNPICPSALSCSCTGGTATGSAAPTATPRAASASATPRATATPRVASIAALPAALPQSGGVADTIFLVASGITLMVLAAVLMLRTL